MRQDSSLAIECVFTKAFSSNRKRKRKKQERVLQRYDEFIKRGRRLESQFHPIVLVEYSFSSKQLDWFWPTKEDSQFENKSKALTWLES
ncbi:hypothetical protein Gasu2_28790 [Galdieria sulphuraria]|nr:hypothetical protein Gasu2_28790 [Galdieria sulphuraria]